MNWINKNKILGADSGQKWESEQGNSRFLSISMTS